MTESNESDRLMKAEEVAEYLGFHVQTIYAKAASGDLPSLKIGSRVRFRREEVDGWLDKQTATAQGVA